MTSSAEAAVDPARQSDEQLVARVRAGDVTIVHNVLTLLRRA